MPARDLISARETVYGNYHFTAITDFSSLPKDFATLAKTGMLPPLSVMVGTNLNETLMYLEEDDALIESIATESFLDQPTQVLDLIGRAEAARARLDRLQTALRFACPAISLANAVSASGGRAFVYLFDRVRDGFETIGAYHGAELPYVFNTHDNWLRTDAIDRRVTESIMGHWISFVRSGSPDTTQGIMWPEWFPEDENILRFGNNPTAIEHPDAKLCKLLGLEKRNPS